MYQNREKIVNWTKHEKPRFARREPLAQRLNEPEMQDKFRAESHAKVSKLTPFEAVANC